MKRIGFSLILALAGIFLFSQSSGAYMINDTTLVERNIGGWVDVIGASVFEIYGIDYSQTGYDLNFSIYTNYPEAGYRADYWSGWLWPKYYYWDTFAGDFGIDVWQDGTYEYALSLKNHDSFQAGKLYSVSSWYDAAHYKPSGSWSYGLADVTAASGSQVGIGSVSWVDIPGTTPNYRIDLTVDVRDFLPGGFDGDIGIYWAAPTCANDIIAGNVHAVIPEPSTWFMLGSGLCGLLAFGIRRKRYL